MRLQLSSTTSALLPIAVITVFSLLTFETQAQAQAQTQSKNPNYHLHALSVISAQQQQQLQQEPITACKNCLDTILPKTYPVCANFETTFNETNKYVIEELMKLPLTTRACFCVMVEPKTVEPCTSADTCGPLSEDGKNNLAFYARYCAELGPQDAIARANALKGGDGKGGDGKTAAGLKVVVADSALFAGLVAVVVAAVAAVAL
ncbi:MAG: hypothetical protein J3R72DRAFT_522352 [Linnemannia gamsii]|nr:MAG: hypothetical protein J3R72DRAFT_522352 [Linnemannia gamsii]